MELALRHPAAEPERWRAVVQALPLQLRAAKVVRARPGARLKLGAVVQALEAARDRVAELEAARARVAVAP